MKKEKHLRTKMMQFSYEHQKLERELKKIRRSTKELCKMLDTLSPKPEKDKKD